MLQLIKSHQLTPHAYADDTQIYGFCRPSDVDGLVSRVSACIDEVSAWMKANRLQLNHAKTEVIWFSSTRRQHQIPNGSVRIGSTSVQPVVSVRDLGVHLDADVTMTTHITAAIRSCFAALRQIRSVQRSLSRHAPLKLVSALVVSTLDYCNAVQAGVAGNHLDRLQSVLNAAARLFFFGQTTRTHNPIVYC